MKCIQRIISFLLVMAMVFSMMPPMSVSAEETEPVTEQTTAAEEETTAPSESVTEPTEGTAVPTEAEIEPTEGATAPMESVEETIGETTEPTEADYIPVESIVISQTEGITELAVGETLQLTATVLPENATDKTVVWSSSDESVATVDENGVIHAIADGYVIVTAILEEVKDVYNLAILRPLVESDISLDSILPQVAFAARAANETPNYTIGVATYTELISRLDTLKTKYLNEKYWTTTGSASDSSGSTSKRYNGKQCKGFAAYIFNDLFCGGYIGSTNDSDYYITSPNNATEVGKISNFAQDDVTTVKNFLSQGKPGDFIQVERRKSLGPHSMILVSIDANGVWLLDCNNLGTCNIAYEYQEWWKFAEKNHAMSLYHSTKYPKDAPSSSYAAPTVANLSINKNSVRIGEEFIFTLSSDTSCDYYLSIVDADSGEYVIMGEKVSTTYKNSFQKAGHYAAWMTAHNSSGSKDSSFVDFWVFGSPPTTASFSASKTEMALGESVILHTSSDAYYVKISIAMFLYNDKNNGTKVCSGEIPYNFSYTPTENGHYTGYVTAWTHEGWVDSNWVNIYVGKYNIKYDANGGSGAPSSQTKIYGKNLTLSSTKPTRSLYNFKGWATNSTAATAAYQAGGTFSLNGNTTLYAVWEHVCAGGHAYNYKVSTSPTTSASGKLTGTCSRCSGTTSVTLPKLNTTDYNYKVVTAAGCTTNGTGRYTWKTTSYGTFYFDVSISKTGHSYSYKASKSPTTSATGTLTGTCSKCSGTTSVTLPKLNTSDYNYAVVTAAGCATNGTGRYTWKTTSYGTLYFDISIPQTGHNYSYKTTKAPTTDASGTLTGTCSKCNGNTTVTFPKLNTTDYNYSVVTEAGCTTTGSGRYTWKTTTYGNYSFDVVLGALDHKYQSVVTAPTCTSGGFTTFTCDRCGDSYVGNETSATGHSWNDGQVTVSATCTADGEKVFTCAVCSETRNEVISAVGHSYNAVVTDPTCIEQGFTTHTCAICSDSYVDDTVSELGHSYEDGYCFRCGETDPNAVIAEGSCGDDAIWKLDINGVLTVSGTGAMDDFAHTPNIPWYDYRYDISSVIIADGITEIGSHSFWSCPNLRSVSIASSVDILGSYCFAYADSLKQIAIPEGVTTIEGSAFLGCENLETVSLPMTITYISGSVFADCVQLTAITLPEGVTDIWNYTFSGCQKLTSVHLGENVKSIGVSAFANCTSLTEINLPNSITAIGKQAFLNCKALCNTEIPENITIIGESAFEGCSNLQNITFGDDLVEIGKRAFWGCSTISSVLIPSSVTFVGSNAFGNCGSLNAINVEPNNGNYFSDSMGVLYDKTQTVLLCIPNGFTGEYDLPVSVTEIASGAASGCINLKGIALNDGLQIIGEYAFANCVQLTTVTIPKTVTGVNRAIFQGCYSMENLVFPGNAPIFNWKTFDQLVIDVYYPSNNATWTSEIMQNYGGAITWIRYGGEENQITIPTTNLDGQNSVWIDGREYAVNNDGAISYIDLPNSDAKTMVVHTYGEIKGEPYPKSMEVWILSNTDGFYTATRVEELDNMLQYEGCSIRVTGTQGIRMITSVDQGDKKALTDAGLAGYTLKEYGTAIAWASQLSNTKPLVLGKSYVRSNYAYKKDVADPIFAYKNDRIQYTNVLVGFSLDQCKNDIAMRPYMILQDTEGNEITLYGGIVERSIGYIALQNKDTFTKGTEAYNYVLGIIKSVYGDVGE